MAVLFNAVYTVQAADTILSIAASVGGVGTTIVSAYNPSLPDDTSARLSSLAGQLLTIPNQYCTTNPNAGSPSSCAIIYTWQQGDSIAQIAVKLSSSGASAGEIQAANPSLSDASAVPSSTTLLVPVQSIQCPQSPPSSATAASQTAAPTSSAVAMPMAQSSTAAAMTPAPTAAIEAVEVPATIKMCASMEGPGPYGSEYDCTDMITLNSYCYQNWNVVPLCPDIPGQEYLYVIRQRNNIGPIDWSAVTELQIFNEPNIAAYVLGDSDVFSNGADACAPYLQLLTNLPDRSAVTTVSPGVAYCVAAPDGSFFAPFCTTNHITFLQQFMDAGCADAVDVMNVHIYQCEWDQVTSLVTSVNAAFPGKPIWITEAGCNDDTSLAASLIENYRTSTLPGLERIYWKSTRTGNPLVNNITGDLTTYGEIFTGKPALPASCCLMTSAVCSPTDCIQEMSSTQASNQQAHASLDHQLRAQQNEPPVRAL
eukprot:jgi/Astpho2/3467/Aster-x1151